MAIVLNDKLDLTGAPTPEVDWEYYDGRYWNELPDKEGLANTPPNFTQSVVVGFTVPRRASPPRHSGDRVGDGPGGHQEGRLREDHDDPRQGEGLDQA